jgi:hypothetical protein
LLSLTILKLFIHMCVNSDALEVLQIIPGKSWQIFIIGY